MHLGRILSRIAIDPLFPPPADFGLHKKTTVDILPENKFELIFESEIDKKQLMPSEDEVISIWIK